MKKILFFYLLLISNSLFSQCLDPVSMGSPTLVDANCPGQGEITVNNVLPLLSGTDYYQYSLYSISNSSEVFTWQNSNIFPNLQAGSYEIRVRTRCAVSPFISVNYITSTVTVNNTELSTSISNVTVLRNSKCNNGSVSAVALGSGPLQYALISSLTELEPIGTYVRPRQAQNRFDSLPSGNYFMRVYNACDNAATIPFTIGVDNSNAQITSNVDGFLPIGCDSVSFGFNVSNFFKNIPTFPEDNQVKAWIKWPSGIVDTVVVDSQALSDLLTPLTKDYIARTSMTKFDPAYNPLTVWPLNLSQSSYVIEMGFRDNCGVIHTNTYTYNTTNTVTLLPAEFAGSIGANCNDAAYVFYIRHSGGPTGITNQGFNSLDNFEISIDGGSTWTNVTTNNENPINTEEAYTDPIFFVRGVANTVLLRYCNTEISATFTAPLSINLKTDIRTDQVACIGYGRARVRRFNANGSKIGVRVLSVPAGQPAIPYFEILFNTDLEYYPSQFANLLPGVYEVELLDTIGITCPSRVTRTITVNAFTFDFSFLVNCNKNLEITSTHDLDDFRVKLFNNLNVQVYGGPNGAAGNTGSTLNIPGTILENFPDGTYTIRAGRRLSNSTDNCSYIEKQWIKNSNDNVTLQNSIFISGCSNGFGVILASANGGSAPYNYTLRDINDLDFPPSIPNGNIYENLLSGDVYKLSVLDGCGAVVNRLITSNSQVGITTPGYSNMPCLGDNINLVIPQFSGVTYAWTKNNVPIPAANSNILSLNNLQISDSATYQSTMTIGGCEVLGSLYINPLNCGGPLSVELTSFSANCEQDGIVRVNWQTASEVNSKDFIVQKSNNLVDWETVDILPGKGNSSINSKYTTLDRNPFDGVSYYQLIQRDYDGEVRTYNPISSSCIQKSDSECKVYPNPSNGNFKVEINVENRSDVDIQILDVNGRIIANQSHKLEIGNHTLFLSENLVKGIYLATILVNKKELKPIKLIVN